MPQPDDGPRPTTSGSPGRGDYEAAEFSEAVAEARRRNKRRTAKYLLGMPMLGD